MPKLVITQYNAEISPANNLSFWILYKIASGKPGLSYPEEMDWIQNFTIWLLLQSLFPMNKPESRITWHQTPYSSCTIPLCSLSINWKLLQIQSTPICVIHQNLINISNLFKVHKQDKESVWKLKSNKTWKQVFYTMVGLITWRRTKSGSVQYWNTRISAYLQ